MFRRTLGLMLAVSAGLVSTAMAQVQTKESQAAMTPAKALDLLKEGNARFVAGKPTPRDLHAQVKATTGGQYPFAAVVSCMDSRVPIELVLDQGIGDVFSLRDAGNVIDTDFLGSLEYAAKVAGARLIAVVGHTHCGAVKGAIDGVDLGNLTALLGKIGPSIAAVGPGGSSKDNAYVDRVAEQNVRYSMREIRERSDIVKEKVATGKIGLVGGMYDIETGKVLFYAD